jgi:hypothetical protein
MRAIIDTGLNASRRDCGGGGGGGGDDDDDYK